MISKEAIAVDLAEARSRLASKQPRSARRQVETIFENLEFLLGRALDTQWQRNVKMPEPSADWFGREALLALQGHCRLALAAIDDLDVELADRILVAAQMAWDKVPATPKKKVM